MPPKILVVDDNNDFRELLLAALAPIGAVLGAADGPEALKKVKAEKPALMLLDLSLPGMGGLAVLKAARALAPELLVVMLTGEADRAVAKQARDLGACSFILKPFNMDVVLDELRLLLK